MPRIFSIVLGYFIVAVFSETTTQAVPISFTATGTVNGLQLAPELLSGDQVSITYTFESTLIDQQLAVPTLGRYGPLLDLTFTGSGGFVATYAPGSGIIEVENDNFFNQDTYAVSASFQPVGTLAGAAPFDLTFTLVDPTKTVFSSDALPLTPPNPAIFSSATGVIRNTNFGSAGFSIDAIVETPEPASILLLLAGIPVLWVTRIRV